MSQAIATLLPAAPLPASPQPDGIEFVAKLAAALHRYGAPAHRLEETMSHVAQALGMAGDFFVTPTAVFASFGQGAHSRTILVRADEGAVHLDKLARLDTIVGEVIRGELSVAQADEALDGIAHRASPYRAWVSVLSYAVASAAAARFFDGGWRELVVAGTSGCLVGLLAHAGDRVPKLARVFDPVSAFVVAAVAALSASLLPPTSMFVATLAGLIVLVPGLTVTVAVNELATRHLVSGVARLAGAGATLLTIGLGVALGGQVAAWMGTPVDTLPRALPGWTEILALIVAPFSFGVLFRAPRRDLLWISLLAVCAFVAARFGVMALGPQLGVFVGSLVAALGSNVYRRVLDRPASVLLVPAIMFLVPGSLGFRSVSALQAQDVVGGIETAFHMGMVAVALVTGMLMGNVLVPPRKPL